jgi:hypothetical protein
MTKLLVMRGRRAKIEEGMWVCVCLHLCLKVSSNELTFFDAYGLLTRMCMFSLPSTVILLRLIGFSVLLHSNSRLLFLLVCLLSGLPSFPFVLRMVYIAPSFILLLKFSYSSSLVSFSYSSSLVSFSYLIHFFPASCL